MVEGSPEVVDGLLQRGQDPRPPDASLARDWRQRCLGFLLPPLTAATMLSMTTDIDLSGYTDERVLRKLTTLRRAVTEAQCDLEDFLLAVHDDKERWQRLSYRELASAMGVSRQAVQQRVIRLLTGARRRRAADQGVDPNQAVLAL